MKSSRNTHIQHTIDAILLLFRIASVMMYLKDYTNLIKLVYLRYVISDIKGDVSVIIWSINYTLKFPKETMLWELYVTPVTKK